MSIQSIDIPFHDATDQDLQTALRFLKETECHYFLSIVDGPKIWDRVMTQAYLEGIAGPQYTWMHSDSLFPETITDKAFPLYLPLVDAGMGASMLLVQAGLEGAPIFDQFVNAYPELQNHPEHLEYVDGKRLRYSDTEDFPYPPFEGIFNAPNPGSNAIFLYDATITMGLAACEAVQEGFELQGAAHYEHIVNTTFLGASRETKINPATGTRDPSSAVFQLLNFVPQKKPVNGTIRFDAVKSDLFQNGVWTSLTP